MTHPSSSPDDGASGAEHQEKLSVARGDHTAVRPVWADVVAGVLLVIVGAGTLIFGRDLALWASPTIGPGLLPKTMGVMLGVFGAILAIQGLRQRVPSRPPDRERAVGYYRVGCTIAILVFLVFTIEPLGFILSTFLSIAAMFVLVERKVSVGAVITTIAVPVVFWFVFADLLQVRLPAGLLAF